MDTLQANFNGYIFKQMPLGNRKAVVEDLFKSGHSAKEIMAALMIQREELKQLGYYSDGSRVRVPEETDTE